MKTIIGIYLFSFFCSLQGLGQCANSLFFNDQSRSVFLASTNEYYSGSNGGFTWECWFKLTQPLGAETRPLIVTTDPVPFEDIWLGFGWSGGSFNEPATKLVFIVNGPNSMAPVAPGCSYEPAGGFQTNVWYHVAATMNYTMHTASLFVNGIQVVSQQTNVPPITRLIPTALSCPLSANGQLTLNGHMDEVQIWSKPLTASEIHAGYENCLSGAEPGLELYYHCNDGGSDQVIMDASINYRIGTFPVGGVWWSDEPAPLADQSCRAHCPSCPPLDAGPDVVICQGGSVQLSAAPGWPFYSWSPSSEMGDPSSGNQVVSPSVTTTYTVQASIVGANLVVNGDFSQGNAGFTNGYINDITYAPCNYYVGPQYFTLTDPMYVDHTPTSDNMMMSIDGCSGGEVLWEQTFAVEPNATYSFGFWATRAAQVQPTFQIIFTGDVTGTEIYLTQNGLPSSGILVWDMYGGDYFSSGNNHTITITVKNLKTDGFGNDFAMDDFSFQMLCNQASQVTVYVNSPPVYLGPDLQICTGASQVLDAGSGYESYLWSDGGTASTCTVSASGTYWVIASDSCGGTHSDTINITMITPPVLDLGSDLQVCAGDTAHFAPVTGPFINYQWSGNDLSCYTCPDPEAFPASSTVYTLTAIGSNGCTATDSLAVIIYQLPSVELGNDLQICAGDTVYLTNAVALNNYQWSGNDLSCSICSSPAVNPVVSGTCFLTSANALGCTSTDSIHVRVFPRPLLKQENDLTICKGDSTYFNYVPSALFTAFSWIPSVGLSCTDCINPEVSPSNSMDYVLTATTAEGCTRTDSIHVLVRDDVPQVFATVTDATCSQGGTVSIEAVGDGLHELQYDFDRHGFSASPLYTPVSAGNYLLTVRNGDDGCPYHGVVVVGGEQNSIFIPNAFTPDGNEFNNTWSISGNCITEISCRIFNRWGEEIAVLNDIAEVWDGTSKGQIVPDGLYIYVMEVTYSTYNKERLTGSVAVLR